MSFSEPNSAGQADPLTGTIVVAGATGHLGSLIVHQLLQRGATVRALVRPGTAQNKVAALRLTGVSIQQADYGDAAALQQACAGAACVVSALSGVLDVIVDIQTQLLQAAVAAKVPRFIPSDYCIDYQPLSPGNNRNLDLRREFARRLDEAPITATSILNGMFTHLLLKEAPVVLFKWHRILYWGNADQLLDFTTIEDTAAYTAAAALDAKSPRYLRIAGDVISARGMCVAASEATGQEFRLLRAGSLKLLRTMIKITRTLFPQKKETFPPWQGMQYLHDMFSGQAKLHPMDNDRYGAMRWTSVKEVLARKESGEAVK